MRLLTLHFDVVMSFLLTLIPADFDFGQPQKKGYSTDSYDHISHEHTAPVQYQQPTAKAIKTFHVKGYTTTSSQLFTLLKHHSMQAVISPLTFSSRIFTVSGG